MTIGIDDFKQRFPDIAAHTAGSEVRALLDALSVREVGKGELLIRDGEPSNALYLVWDGTLVTYIESDQLGVELGHVRAGDWFGEVSMLDPGPATATVRAETPCTVLILTADSFRQLDRTHPVVTSKLLRLLASLLIDRLTSSDELLIRTPLATDSPSPGGLREWSTRIYRRLLGRGGAAA